jgi:hypothetical protein
VPWIVGALLHRTAREALWTLAVAVDYAAVILRYPTPGPGRCWGCCPPLLYSPGSG